MANQKTMYGIKWKPIGIQLHPIQTTKKKDTKHFLEMLSDYLGVPEEDIKITRAQIMNPTTASHYQFQVEISKKDSITTTIYDFVRGNVQLMGNPEEMHGMVEKIISNLQAEKDQYKEFQCIDNLADFDPFRTTKRIGAWNYTIAENDGTSYAVNPQPFAHTVREKILRVLGCDCDPSVFNGAGILKLYGTQTKIKHK